MKIHDRFSVRHFQGERCSSAISAKVIRGSLSGEFASSRETAKSQSIPPVHPGVILKETLDDLSISMNRLAQGIGVPANRISAIVAGQRAITGETALRLGRNFETTPAYCINMQARNDLEAALEEWEARIQPPASLAPPH